MQAIKEIQNTLAWLMSHKWNTTEAHAMVIFVMAADAGKPDAGCADTVSQLIVMFSWMMPSTAAATRAACGEQVPRQVSVLGPSQFYKRK